eukprot:CAMPEP_0113499410 /NCGR_PEP_ID=MMETSP0014_2-20120614/31734_1 /TAXON_ID=2857 /ORGANISM="Nitzschia sp." /LENGTH=256 /DNA_ID=CAMNT_0000393585 /DNA_START=114 /DNA_END=884 /DNA_ORIENTATION=- /assembly_acc=CAM_ASM_000159
MSSSPLDVAQNFWDDIQTSLTSDGGSSGGTPKVLEDHLQTGWTSDEALVMREKSPLFVSSGSSSGGATPENIGSNNNDGGTFNVVKPPVDCPAWLCILLPCLNHLPSMKAFKTVNPDDAEVCRGGRWTRYDAASLVVGDVIRLEEGDLVPADCIVVSVDEGEQNILVDLKTVTGLDRPKSISDEGTTTTTTRGQRQLYMGGTIVQGRATAIVTSIGPYTLLGTLIRQQNFPPKDVVLEASFEDAEPSSSIQMASMA